MKTIDEIKRAYLDSVYSEFADRGYSRKTAKEIIGKTGFIEALDEYPREQLHYSVEDAVDEILSAAYEKDGDTVRRAVRVKAIKNKLLLVRFDNGERKVYNCYPLIEKNMFAAITDDTFFNSVHTDEMGLVCWDDSTDIAPYELYENSVNVIEFCF